MLEKITTSNAAVFESIVQDYEEEFSPITKKKKSLDGTYSLDSDWKSPNEGFYWVEDQKVKGFCIKGSKGSFSDISEFYVIPSFRHKGIGKKFAFAIFDTFPGKWQVRQILGADKAKEFWRKIISEYTSNCFEDLEFKDPYWGHVSCQKFESRVK